MISKDLGKITRRALPLQSYWLSVIQSKQTKEKQDTAAQACDSKRGILSSDLSDGALTTFLAKCQSVLSTNWACVSEGEIKRLQLPTETSSPGPAVKHKSKAAAPRLFGTAETQPTTSNNKAPVSVVMFFSKVFCSIFIILPRIWYKSNALCISEIYQALYGGAFYSDTAELLLWGEAKIQLGTRCTVFTYGDAYNLFAY